MQWSRLIDENGDSYEHGQGYREDRIDSRTLLRRALL